jgi:hypothetical protein
MKYFRLKSREHAFAVSVYRSMKQIGVIAAIQASEDIVSKVRVIEDLATVVGNPSPWTERVHQTVSSDAD